MTAAVSALVVVAASIAFLPLTLSVFAYAFVEARGRRAWSIVASPAVRVGTGPYRAVEVAPSPLQRAPLLVRTAALGCFYWSWFCILAWSTVGLTASDPLRLEPVALASVVVAIYLGRAGVRLLRRDPRAVTSGRRVAVAAAGHATLLVVLGFAVGGSDWSAPAAVFGAVSLGQAALLVYALREHARLFARPADADTPERPLPTWLARLLARRAQARANFLASASHTRAGA